MTELSRIFLITLNKEFARSAVRITGIAKLQNVRSFRSAFCTALDDCVGDGGSELLILFDNFWIRICDYSEEISALFQGSRVSSTRARNLAFSAEHEKALEALSRA
jgi:hypothetical protein